MNKIIPVLILISVIIFAGWMVHRVWTLGSNAKDYQIICLTDHQYWQTNFAAKSTLAIRLDDEGKPIPCVNNHE